MEFDKQSILNGTSRKKLLNMFNELKSNLNKNDAIKYYLVYNEMPLSDVLQNFDLIYKEPYRGIKFLKDLVLNHDIPSLWYQAFSDEVGGYLNDKGKNMAPTQYSLYKDALSVFKDVEYKNRRLRGLMLFLQDDIYESDVVYLYNIKYDYVRANNEASKNQALDKLKDVISNADINLLQHIIVTCFGIEELVTYLSDYIRRLFSDTEQSAGIITSVKANAILSRMVSDDIIKEKLSKHNTNFKHLVYEYADCSNLINMINNITIHKEQELPVYSSMKDCINNVYNQEILDDLSEEENTETKIDVLMKEKDALSTTSDFYLFDLLSASDDELEDAYDEALSDLYISGNSESFNESTHSHTEYMYNLFQSRIITIEEELYTLEFTKDGKPSKVIANETGDDYKKDKQNKKQDVEVDKKKKEEPKKPKTGAMQTVQNKAMDLNVKTKKTGQAVGKAVQQVKNTAKAIGKIPENIVSNIKKQVKEWDDLDDERRKKYILQAGFRKKYFRLFRLALSHYALFLVNPLLNIVLFICQHFSKEKDSRIKNELASELEAEIKICEEKIEIAKGKGDNENMFKLIRIKDKLTAELTRVKTNSSYV